MDVEEIQFHRQTVSTDDNSPLHLIREKEMEISGRVLAAKREADDIVASARRQAAEMVAAAHEAATQQAGERDAQVQAEMEREAVKVRAESEAEAAALEESMSTRRAQAVAYVVETVVTV